MTDDEDISIILYDSNLLPEEKRLLRSMEREILRELIENSLTNRPIWSSRMEENSRFLQLVQPDDPKQKVLLDLSSSDLDTISSDVLVLRLKNSIRQG